MAGPPLTGKPTAGTVKKPSIADVSASGDGVEASASANSDSGWGPAAIAATNYSDASRWPQTAIATLRLQLQSLAEPEIALKPRVVALAEWT